jgi:hypothetical protein
MGNRASVHGFPRRSRPLTPAGSQPPCGVGHRVRPSPHHDSRAFAFSHVPYRLRRFPCLRVGDSRVLRFALPWRANPAYHVPRVAPTSRGRMPLDTGRVNGCVGAPFKRPDLPSVPFWRWGRMVALAPPALRCVIPRLQLPYPSRPFPADETVCHSQALRCTECLRPRRYQRRPPGAGTGGTTPG